MDFFKAYLLYFPGPHTGAIATLEKLMGVVLFWVIRELFKNHFLNPLEFIFIQVF